MDQVTGPPEAVRLIELPSSGVSRSEVGVTVSVPGAGGGGALLLLAGVLVDGAGELGFGLALDGGAEVGRAEVGGAEVGGAEVGGDG
jgi:hypothetical protein